MAIFNSLKEWGTPAKTFHWLIAVLVIGLFTLGLIQVRWPVSPLKFELYAWHKSFGILVLLLVSLRLVWRLINRQVPQLPPTMNVFERFLANATHYAFYVILLSMPLSGWIFTSAANFPLKLFDIVALPAIVPPDKDLSELARDIHHWLGWTLAGVFTLHVAGALKHHFIDRDDVLKRMLPGLSKDKPS